MLGRAIEIENGTLYPIADAQATPGRWRHEQQDARLCRRGTEELHGVIVTRHTGGTEFIETLAENVTSDDARLICAAVNAVREAGYTVEELERGSVAISENIIDCARSGEDVFLRHVARDRALLAECREALEAFRRGLQDGSIAFTKRRQADAEPHHPANVAMCAVLAKLDAHV